MKIQLTITAVLSCLALEASAFWRMLCSEQLSIQMIDPIVNPGAAGKHVHHIQGPDTMSANATFDDLRAGTCSSCQVKQDNSGYWVPQMYFKHSSTGEFEIVPRINDMLIYYLQRGENVTAFPKGFQMVAGDSHRRNFTCRNIPTSQWGPQDMTQDALAQKAIGFNCLNYDLPAEASLSRHTFPDDLSRCKNGLRVEFFFPSCWDGRLDSPNHMDHVQYPDLVQDGTCPSTHPYRLVSLFFEIIWDVNIFSQHDGEYVFSNGDPTGYGFHADFMNGWEEGVLQNAIDNCQDESGIIEDCKVFQLYSQTEMNQCKINHIDVEGDVSGPMGSLPGCNEVQYGPEPATCPTKSGIQESVKPSSTPAPSTPAPPVNVVTQTHTHYTTVDVYATPEPAPCPRKQKRHHHHFGHRHKF